MCTTRISVHFPGCTYSRQIHLSAGSENQNSSEGLSTIGGSPNPRAVYVFQRERATVLPSFVDVVGTDEMTTCIAVALRDPETGRQAFFQMAQFP
jgi:hypothetical protein